MSESEILGSAKEALKEAFGDKSKDITVTVTSSPANTNEWTSHEERLQKETIDEDNRLKSAIQDTKIVKQTALENAKSALQNSFSEKISKILTFESSSLDKKNTIKQKVTPHSNENITEKDIDRIINELEEEGGCNVGVTECYSSPETKNSFNETKTLIQNFKEKVAKYPKYLSYDGSTVLCVLLSMEKTVRRSTFTHLPIEDQEIIKNLIPEKCFKTMEYFQVEFDNQNDFEFTFFSAVDNYKITMFNSLIHPKVGDMTHNEVQVKKDGENISVGGKIVLNKKGIQRMIGVDTSKKESEDEIISRRQPVSGRNAFEIREDILEAAIDVVKSSQSSNKESLETSVEIILEVAKKFYSFVENKRY
jgi:hypothetical protein